MSILEKLEVKERSKATPRFLLIGIFCVFHLFVAVLGPINVFEGELLDTDSYTRLNRVLFVYEGGNGINPSLQEATFHMEILSTGRIPWMCCS